MSRGALPQGTAPRLSLEPASPTVPAAAENNQHDDDNDQKCRRVHAALLTRPPTEAGLRGPVL
jgi:hypothetical protein